MKKIKIAVFIIILLAIGLWAAGKISDRYTVKPKEVLLSHMRLMENFEVSTVWVTGAIESVNKREVFAEITGILDKLPVKEGDIVTKGQELAILRKAEITKNLQDAENQLKEAELNLAKVVEAENKKNREDRVNIVQKEISLEDARSQLLQVEGEVKTSEKKDEEAIKATMRTLEEAQNASQSIEKDFVSVESQAELTVKESEIARKEAEGNLNRQKELFDAKIISQKQLEEAQNSCDKAKLQYEYALKALDHVKLKKDDDLDVANLKIKECVLLLQNAKDQALTDKSLNQEKIASAREKLENSRLTLSISGENSQSSGEVALAQEKVSQNLKNLELAQQTYLATQIRSPIDGKITLIDKEIKLGKEITAGNRILIVADLKDLHIKAQVNQEDISSISVGQTVKIFGCGIRRESAIRGHVSSIAPMGQPGERKDEKKITFEVMIDFKIPQDDTMPDLRAGMSVDLEFVTNSRKNVYIVYSNSIVKKGDTAYVYLYDHGKARKTEIKTGISDMFCTEILSGLRDTDIYVTNWEGDLSEGDLIKERKSQND